MSYEWLEDYCVSKPGAVKEWKAEWNVHRYMVGGKMFLMDGGDKEGKPIISVKLEPMRGNFMREQYDAVVPGYYMNKEHWNSVYRDGDVPDDILKEMIDESYSLIFTSLPKKKQAEIVEGQN